MATVTLPYSLTAGSAENVNQLNSNLNALVLGTYSIDTAQINDGQITTAKIQDGTIVNADISSSAAIAYSKLNLANSLVTADLTASSVTEAKIADSAVTSAKIAAGTIVEADIADSAVTSAKIADGTIATADLADASVTNAKLATTAWTTYTPSMKGDLADPTLGNSTIAGAYQRINNTVFVRIKFTVGSTFAAGVSNYFTFSLPSGNAAVTTYGTTIGEWFMQTAAGGSTRYRSGFCQTDQYSIGTSAFLMRGHTAMDSAAGVAEAPYSSGYDGCISPGQPYYAGLDTGAILSVNLHYQA